MKRIYLIRHGETAWSKSGQHTGNTDLELTENGMRQAEQLKKRLSPLSFDHVFSSPLKRAKKTAEICGYANPSLMDELREWDYGDYEGLTSDEIHQKNPTWNLFKEGAPGGDSLEAIEKRADLVFKKLNDLEGTIALFSSGHISRVLGARWIGLPASGGAHFYLKTASLSLLGFEHDKAVIHLWNETSYID